MKPHKFIPIHARSFKCATCGDVAAAPIHSYALPGMEGADAERGDAQAQAQGEDLTAELLKPKADISSCSGQMEREAPLFFGTGANPALF